MKRIFEGSGGHIMPTRYIRERYTLDMLILRRLYANEIKAELKAAEEARRN